MTNVDFKVILLGSQGVGKTCVFMKYIYETYSEIPYKSTLGAVFGSKNVKTSKGDKFSIGIWDTAGSERYYSMTRLYYRDAHIAIVCYDPYSTESWEKVKFWVEELKKYEEDCIVYIVQTKTDLIYTSGRKVLVDRHDCEEFADSIKARFCLVSSKTGENIEELFQAIIDDLSENEKCLRQVRIHREKQKALLLESQKDIRKKECVCSI